MKRLGALSLVTALLLAALGIAVWRFDQTVQHPPASEEAFAVWLESSAQRRSTFLEFEALLAQEGVASVVPAWQLTRTDAVNSADCNASPFIVPPREEWMNIVPALQLIESHIKPKIGPVEVMSAYRPPEFNVCARGAAGSKHLSFEAVDLIAVSEMSNTELFDELCAIWRESGRRSNMGLGAYFEPSDSTYNRSGRFHIDASGYRTWGRNYSSDTSPCL